MKRFLRALALTVAATLPGAVLAQAFPIKPVRLVVPFPPGGATDIIARLLGQKLQEIWGQSVLIEYKPGGGTVVGTDFVAKSPPDGYTMGMVITAHVINPGLRSDLPYDTTKDLAGVSMVAVSHIALVATPGLEANTVPELIELAKRKPGEITYGSSGFGAAGHVNVALLESMAGIKLAPVHYRGATPALNDVLAGHIMLTSVSLSASVPPYRVGKAKMLAVGSAQRRPEIPEVPTTAETVPGYEATAWFGIGFPKGTPRDIIDKLNAEVNRALSDPKMLERLAELGGKPIKGTPEDFGKVIAAETAKWAKVVIFSGAKAE